MADDRDLMLRRWLALIASLVLVLVVLGAVSRLGHSGPLLGTFVPIASFLPPITAHGWQALLDQFRQVPGFSVDEAAGMTLAQFRQAYLWEWARLFAEHAIDVVLVAGFVVLIARARGTRRFGRGLQVLLVLGAAQALLGWWLGLSGLEHRKDLAQFVVAARLASAGLLFAWSVWLARRVRPPGRQPPVPDRWFWAVAGLGSLVFVQVIGGAFAAGLRSGSVFNTWPLMNGALIPDGLWFFSPWWKNLVANALSVQFLHRLLGYVILLYAAGLVVVSRRPSFAEAGVRRMAAWTAALVLAQVSLGVATVLSAALLPFALGHLVVAFAIVGLLAAHLGDLRSAASRAAAAEPGPGAAA